MFPQYSAKVANILFPALVGELVLMLWLIIRGVNMERWKVVSSEEMPLKNIGSSDQLHEGWICLSPRSAALA
jgi:hypothetical protein